MSEKFPSSPPPPEQIESRKRNFSGITFQKKLNRDGSASYRSDDPERKLIVLTPDSTFKPEEGVAYDVSVIEDSKPGSLTGGKYVVRIIGEGGVPIDTEQKELRLPSPIEVDRKKKVVYVLETELPYNEKGGPLVPPKENFSHFTLDRRTVETIEKIATAVELGQPCLLEGETSTSKTSSIEYLAMVTNHEVTRLNLNGQTDTSELIGKFVPNDGELQIEFEKALEHPELIGEGSRKLIERAHAEGRSLTLVESQKIAKEEGLKISDWRWQDGIIPGAMKKGHWVILDEMNLAEPQILERLNSVLERHPSITLSENGGAKIGSGGKFDVDKRFRIFGTMNPAEYAGRNAMTPAFKDRWTSYKFIEAPTQEDYVAMMELLVYGGQPNVSHQGVEYEGEATQPLYPILGKLENFHLFIAKLAKFQINMEQMARTREIGKNRKEHYIFTRRGLLEFLSYLETKSIVDRKKRTKKTIQDDPKAIILRGLQYYFLDKIVDQDDRRKVKDQLDAIGISEQKWLLKM